MQHDLAEKLGRRERDDLEFKRNVSDRNAIREAVCAMANDLPGRGVGHLLIGVEDNGASSGLPINEALLSFLAGLRTEGRILPPPILAVGRAVFDGHECVHVEIPGTPSPPVRFDGRVFVRVGPSTRRATPDEERLLAERRRAADLPFDQRPLSGTGLRDLDLELFRSTYLPAAVSPEVVVNALMHRNYETSNAPVSIRWFADRVEITSPGGPFGAVTAENFDRRNDYRNPGLAAAMKELGYVNRFGRGIGLVRSTLAANGNPSAEFAIEPTYWGVTVRAAG